MANSSQSILVSCGISVVSSGIVYYKLSERLIPLEKKIEEMSTQNPFQTTQTTQNYQMTIKGIIGALRESEKRIGELEQQVSSLAKYIEQIGDDDKPEEKKVEKKVEKPVEKPVEKKIEDSKDAKS